MFMIRTFTVIAIILILSSSVTNATYVFVEAESFCDKGGWCVDQQFMDQMGSPYLIAHGMGNPVDNAETTVVIPEKGTYYVWVRTKNWTAPWLPDKPGPGRFGLKIQGKTLSKKLGISGSGWNWEYAGKTALGSGSVRITLQDHTGFDGRCDAIYLSTDPYDMPPSDIVDLTSWRKRKSKMGEAAKDAGEFDFVVAGGGIAGISAAVSAARLGCKVALINDRPVFGGNNSSEVRVHLGGALGLGKFKELGGLQKEFGPIRKGNAQPGDYYEDDKKLDFLNKETNVTLFPNYHVNEVKMNSNRISSIVAQNITTGERLKFSASVFADCTGDASLGYLAGADFRMGREGRSEFGEPSAPDNPDSLTMGTSVQWRSRKVPDGKGRKFPLFSYGLELSPETCHTVTKGEWTWETGMNRDQIQDFEEIRDYGLLVAYTNWSFIKNNLGLFPDRDLDWVAYIGGKRESRRLMGDYILKEDDIVKHVNHEDASFTTTWTIDLHFPDSVNSIHFPGAEFIAATNHRPIYPYSVPYRCLYSRNIDNLFMAGRNISVTHIALGTVRVMRTTGAMGEVVGMAADICRRNKALPRDVYRNHLSELKDLMNVGVNKKGLPNNQKYNEGKRLKKAPDIVNDD